MHRPRARSAEASSGATRRRVVCAGGSGPSSLNAECARRIGCTACALVALVGCAAPPQTIVVLEADEGIAGSLRVRICDRDGAVRRDDRRAVAEFPQRVPVSALGGDADRWFALIAELDDGSARTAIRLAAGYPREGRREIVRRFHAGCAGALCSATGSCANGTCESAIDPSASITESEAERVFAACAEDPADAGRDGGADGGLDGGHDASDACEGCGPALHVAADGTDAIGGCTEAAPCRTVQFVLDNALASGGGRVLLRPGGVFEPFVVRAEHSGTPGRRLEIAAESGSPLVDASSVPIVPDHAIEIAEGAHDVAIVGLHITGAPRSGIYVHGADMIDIEECEIYANGTAADTRGDGAGVWIEDSTSASVERCVIRNNVSTDGDVYGIRIVDGSDHTLIGNRIFGNTLQGIEITDSARALAIRGNAVCRNGAHAIRATSSTEIVIDHNTLIEHDNLFTGDPTNNGDGIATVGASGVIVTNNILAFDSTGLWQSAMGEPPIEHHNLFFGNALGDRNRVTPPDPDTSVYEDPELVSPAACQGTIAETSPARGAGEGGSNIGLP